MCLNLMLHFALVILLALEIRAQEVYYITSAFTECFRIASASDTLSPDPAKQSANPTIILAPESDEVGPSNPAYSPLSRADLENPEGPQSPGVVTHNMPPCAVCDCPTCTTTSVFTTMLPDFGPSGPSERPYIIIETYFGMSSLPYFPTPTPVPYGFTTAVKTCRECGTQTITGTVITPKTGRPLGQDMAVATGGLDIRPSGAASPKSGADLPPDISEATNSLGTQRSGAPPPKSGPDLPMGVITTFNNVGAVETTFPTRTEHIAGGTQAGGQYSEARDGEVRTSEPSATPTSYIQVSAAELFWGNYLLSYYIITLTCWAVVLFQ